MRQRNAKASWVMRKPNRGPRPPRRVPRYSSPAIEHLEERVVLSLSTATWTDIGPGSSTLTSGQVEAPITNGQIPGGGAVSGRVTGIAADPTNASIMYLATAGGGVWKTTDGGSNWKPLTDNVTSGGNPVPEFMGAIAIAPSNSQVLYAGTGEANNGGDTYAGEGILVSQNGGQTWTLAAQPQLQGTAISRIAVDPQDPSTAYVAVSNAATGGNGAAATGIYKLTNFGATVTNVTQANTTAAGAPAGLDATDPWSDVVIDPTTTGGGAVLFAAVGNQNGAAGNGVYSSTDGGAHWTTAPIGAGLLSGATVGRISLSLAHVSTPGSAAVIYASMATSAGPAGTNPQNLLGLFQSTNGGSTWTNITSNLKGDDYLKGSSAQGQGGYDNVVGIDPVNPNRVFVAGVLKKQGGASGFTGGGIEVSTNGGSTWSEINVDGSGNGPHTDYHALTFDASDQLLAGNDGGIFRLGSNNAWADLNANLEITQFYGISLSGASSNIVFGGVQDNGTEEYDGNPTWKRPASNATSGDGGTTIVDPNNPNRVYVLANQTLSLSTDGGATFSSLNKRIKTFSATPNINFVSPYAIDGAGDVFFGTDEVNLCTTPTAKSPNWSQIGIPGTNNFNPGDSPINAIAVDPNDTANNTVYVSAGSRLFVTKNAQAGTACTWTAIDGTVAGNGWPGGFVVGGVAATFPQGDPFSLVVPRGGTAGTAFAVGTSNVIVTTNYGGNWTDITGAGLPANIALDSIAVVPGFGVYVGTDAGVYFTSSVTVAGNTTTIGAPVTWSRFQSGLPNAQVTDLVAAQYPDVGTVLAAGTHGRGVWEILLAPGAASPPITGFGAKIAPFGGTNGNMGPALATINGITYMAWTGRDNNQINITPLHADGSPVLPPAVISSLTSNSSVSLATLGGQMYVAFTGQNGHHEIFICAVNINGGSISLGPAVDMGQTSDNAPTLSGYEDLGGNEALYLGWTGRGGNLLNIMEVNTVAGISAGPTYTSPALTVDGSPTLASAFGQLWVGFTGETNDVFFAPVTLNFADFSVFNVPTPTQLPEKSDFSPSMTLLNGRLYIAWTAQGNPILGSNRQFLEVLQILPGGGFVEPHLSDSGNTSNNVPALGIVNGAPVIAWAGTDGGNSLNLEFLSTSVPGVVLTPQSLDLTGDIGGTNESDVFVVGSQAGGVQVSSFSGGEGVAQSFAPGTVSTITIQPMGGNNTIVLNAIPQGVTVNIESTGSDFIEIGGGTLAGILGSITITGSGQDVILLDDSQDAGASNATLNGGSLDFNGRSSLAVWSGLQHLAQLAYFGGAAANTINVLGTSAPTTVVGGGSTNVFDVGSATPGALSGSLAGLSGPLSIAGGVGPAANNRILISDAADGSSDAVTAIAESGDDGPDGVGDGDAEVPPNDGNFTFQSASLPGAGAVINFTGTFTDSAGSPDGIALWGSNAASAGNVYNIQATPFGDTIQVNGDGGSDTFNVSSDAPVNTGDLDGVQGTVSLIGGAGTGNQLNINDAGDQHIWDITGTNAGDFDGGAFISFAGIQGLRGGAEDDTFAFFPGGSVAGSIDGGGGLNTLDDSRLSGPITVNLQTDTAPAIGGTFAGIGNFVGSAGAQDTMIGPDAGAVWSLTGSNSGSVNGLTYSSFEDLTGGGGTDAFVFFPGGGVSGNIGGGGGLNTLDDSNLSGPVTVNLQFHTAPGIGGTFANIGNLVGSASAGDTLVGPDAGAVWSLTGSNAGSVSGVTYASFENLTGGAGVDRFDFFPGGSVSGNLDGGAGNDTVDYSNISYDVTVNLSNSTATGVGGIFLRIENFIGGSGTNTVVGPNTNTVWDLTGSDTFTVAGINFVRFQDIVGGSGDDRFVIHTGASISGSIDGGGGNNTIDYSPYVGDITVNLGLGYATAIGKGIKHIENVIGSIGNDVLVGDALPNSLTGGTGRNVIIGDAGADVIVGGGGDNILIGGTTDYDLNLVALASIMKEWTRTDLSFEQRVADLISEGPPSRALNGPYQLNKKTISDDGVPDNITGGGSSDWFFADKNDTVRNRKPGDHITN